MKLNKCDLQQSFYWLTWVPRAREQGRPQEYIDRQAMHRIIVYHGQLSPDVEVLLCNAIHSIKDSPGTGKAEELMTSACRYIIQQANSTDFAEYISTIPNYPKSWMLIWNEIRASTLKGGDN